MSWERPFDQPVPLPSGPPARTLRDAANYIKTLAKSQRDTPEWRLAIQMLIDAAENRGPMLFAKIGIVRAAEQTLSVSLTRFANISIEDATTGSKGTEMKIVLVDVNASKEVGDVGHLKVFANEDANRRRRV